MSDRNSIAFYTERQLAPDNSHPTNNLPIYVSTSREEPSHAGKILDADGNHVGYYFNIGKEGHDIAWNILHFDLLTNGLRNSALAGHETDMLINAISEHIRALTSELSQICARQSDLSRKIASDAVSGIQRHEIQHLDTVDFIAECTTAEMSGPALFILRVLEELLSIVEEIRIPETNTLDMITLLGRIIRTITGLTEPKKIADYANLDFSELSEVGEKGIEYALALNCIFTDDFSIIEELIAAFSQRTYKISIDLQSLCNNLFSLISTIFTDESSLRAFVLTLPVIIRDAKQNIKVLAAEF
jgi:hypothetical protein